MAISPRPFVLAALSVGPLVLLAGCGAAASGARTTVQPVQPSSYVVQEPVTTTTTTTAPPNVTTPVGQISATEQIYTIVAGDSISKIAGLHEITMDDLVNYNGWTDGLAHVLIPGQTVKIPPNALVPGTGTGGAGGGDAGTGGEPPTGPAPNTGECPTTYTIQAGDTTRIAVAERFGITFEQMDAANVNTPGYSSFVVGTEIIIPCPT